MTAEQIITVLYARIGRPAPRFLWFDDPLSCFVACCVLPALSPRGSCGFSWSQPWEEYFAALAFKRPVQGQIPSNLWSSLDSHLQGALRTSIQRRRLRHRAGLEFWKQLGGAFWGHIEQMRAAVTEAPNELDGRLGDRLSVHLCNFGLGVDPMSHFRMNRIEAQVKGFWGGAVEGGFRPHEPDEPRAPPAARLDALQRACGWWYPCERAVICSTLPRRIHVDTNHALHNQRGPAVEFSRWDKVYAWHGTPVFAEWIEQRETLDPSVALHWPNLAERRAAAEIIGWAKVIDRVPKRVIDADRDPQIGTLLECDLPGSRPERFLRVRCGTGREFALSVPREATTARQANAWTYGLHTTEYQLEARS